MAKFTHYLVTRFNVPMESWRHDKSGHITLDEAWLQHRLSLFQRFCVPAVAQQTNTNFQWIIYCDRATHHDQLRGVEASVQDIPKVSIRLVDQAAELVADLKILMTHSPSAYVITSRLDNDDGLGLDFIQTVQEHFQEEDRLLINLDGGIQFDMDHKILTRLKTETTNSYTSLIEIKSSPELLLTVFGFHHTDVPSGVKVVHVKKGFHWLKIIHQRNVRSNLRGKPIFNTNHKALAAFEKSEFSISIWQTLVYVVKRRREIWTSR